MEVKGGLVDGNPDVSPSVPVVVPKFSTVICRLLQEASPTANDPENTEKGMIEDTKPMSFVMLPLEVREQIYLFALCPGEVYPHGKPIETGRKYSACQTNGICSGELDFQRPSLALLQTCAQVHDEALPMYLSLNRFVIQEGDVFGSMRFMTDLPDDKLRHIKSLTLKFSAGDLAGRDRESAKGEALSYMRDNGGLARFTYMRDNGGLARFTREERQDIIHKYEMDRLRQIWFEKYDFVVNLPTLKDVILDFTDIECPTGCCRPETLGLSTARWIGAYGDNLPHSRLITAAHDQEAIEQIITNIPNPWPEAE